MFGQLGLITFHLLKEPTEMSEKATYTYAHHPVIKGKTKLQYTGQEPKQISMKIRLHASFCNVEAQLLLLEGSCKLTAGNNFIKALPFFLGSGKFLGNYVITDISKEYVKTFPNGKMLECIVTLTLEEYYFELQNQLLDKVLSYVFD